MFSSHILTLMQEKGNTFSIPVKHIHIVITQNYAQLQTINHKPNPIIVHVVN